MREKGIELKASIDELPEVVRQIREIVPIDAVISLKGDLAAGKTTLVQAVAKEDGISGHVTSPTFSLQHCYGERLFHYDLYRIGFEEMMRLGLFEEFDKPGWHLVEWADEKLKSFLAAAGYNLWEIAITPEGDRRIYSIRLLNA
jgi:tRNA threonylcarbamoyladenosine biosynthesis protein TsaE